jgi:hypothetical protein
MASQAFSASANVLKGDPPTLTAVLFKLMGRQEATKPGFPWSPGPLLLSLLITNEKPHSLALHISSSCVAGAMRLKCMGAFHDPASQSGPRFSGWGRQPVGRFSSGQGALGASAGSGDSTPGRTQGSCEIAPQGIKSPIPSRLSSCSRFVPSPVKKIEPSSSSVSPAAHCSSSSSQPRRHPP